MLQAICDAMSDDQECLTHKDGDCNPFTHYFPPSEPPPEGWARGQDGLYAPPPDTVDDLGLPQGPGHSRNTLPGPRLQYTPGSLAGLDLAMSTVLPLRDFQKIGH